MTRPAKWFLRFTVASAAIAAFFSMGRHALGDGREDPIAQNAQELVQAGRQTFRFDTFGDVTGFFNADGSLNSVGIQCALCHSTVDDSFRAPGIPPGNIGHRLDGWANRDLNVGAVANLAPDLSVPAKVLGVDQATVRKVLLGRDRASSTPRCSWTARASATFQADRSPDGIYRTSPLAGLFTHQKGGFYHDGRFATLLDVVNQYDSCFNLGLSSSEKADLVQYLLTL